MNKSELAKHRLSDLSKQVTQLKKELTSLRQLQQQFTFQSLLPKTTPNPKRESTKKYIADVNDEHNKENISHANNCQNSKPKNNKDIKESKDKDDKKHKTQTKVSVENIDNVDMEAMKIKKEEMQGLKAGLMLQLSQIKSMQKRSQSMRRINQRIQQYNNKQKREYLQSHEKPKQPQNSSIHDISSISIRETPIQQKQVDSLNSSKITLAPTPASSMDSDSQVLRCPKGHEYYEGSVNGMDLPHGNGRLDVCCGCLPADIGGTSLKDFLFYQGGFQNGRFHGFGTLSYRGGVKYVGEFTNGKRHGKGSVYCNGKAEVAIWHNDSFISII